MTLDLAINAVIVAYLIWLAWRLYQILRDSPSGERYAEIWNEGFEKGFRAAQKQFDKSEENHEQAID